VRGSECWRPSRELLVAGGPYLPRDDILRVPQMRKALAVRSRCAAERYYRLQVQKLAVLPFSSPWILALRGRGCTEGFQMAHNAELEEGHAGSTDPTIRPIRRTQAAGNLALGANDGKNTSNRPRKDFLPRSLSWA
jgi:hypothetical protein